MASSKALIKPAWLVLLFSLPLKKASERVGVWRKLKRYGALPLRSSGYVLPYSLENQERFEWLAAAIRKYKGQASVLEVNSIDDFPTEKLIAEFVQSRSQAYNALLGELQKVNTSRPQDQAKLRRLRKQFQNITEIDFFEPPIRKKIETILAKTDNRKSLKLPAAATRKNEYRNRLWVTRPGPGIDRVASAWLIQRFIDSHAKFTFASDAALVKEAIPFDTFQSSGFGHRGDDCTFETLSKEFGISDAKVRAIAEMVHDADLGDEKFGRSEALGIEKILKGWRSGKMNDHEVLRRGMEMIAGLYESL